MNRDQMKYESRLKGLKQKYRHLNGKVPVHSYDNRELKQLEENQLHSRYAFYKFKKEINIEQLLSTIEEMKKLQVVYADLKQAGSNEEEIKQTQRKYNEYLVIYKDITGTDYSAAIGVYLAGLPKIQATNAGLSAIAEETTANIGQSNSGQINSGQSNSGQSKNITANIASKIALNELTNESSGENKGKSETNESNETNETSASNEESGKNETGEGSNIETSANSGANETKKVNFSV
jgi:hypothetical protein